MSSEQEFSVYIYFFVIFRLNDKIKFTDYPIVFVHRENVYSHAQNKITFATTQRQLHRVIDKDLIYRFPYKIPDILTYRT